MADGTIFPAFLKLEYQPSNSAKATFLAEMASITSDAEREFKDAFGNINQVISRSISGFKNNKFSLDLDLSGLRDAAAQAAFAAERVDALRIAAINLSRATGDKSAATVKYIEALSKESVEADRARDAAQAQLVTYQRLQGEIDKTAASNTKLAESYRATFAEQAKAANYAAAFQQAINQRAGTNLNDFGPKKSARESASVFASQPYAPQADMRSPVQRLIGGDASIDRAALSATTLEQVLGRVSSKGREVAAALKAAEDAAAALAAQQQKELDTNLAKAAADAKAYAASAAQLRAQLDPSIAIQQKFDAELTRADELLAAGVISQREYGLAVAYARDRLNESWQALTRNSDAAKALANAKPIPAGPGPQTTLSGADALVAGRASVDRAAISGTTLEQVLGRVASKGKDVAAALREAEQASRGVVSQQERLLEVQEAIDAALAKSRNTSGSLDLGVTEIQQSAAALEARAVAAREVANAMQIAAREEGDYSAATMATIAAAKRLADQEEKAAAAAREHAAVAERVQEVLNRQASATDLVVAATRRGTSEGTNVINSIRAQRVAFTQLGQQMQDVVVQTQMGTNATTIFVQQVPQMAFALSGLSESTNKTYSRIGKVASFLSGPWGAAIFAAIAVIGPLIAATLEFGDATEKAVDKLKKDAAETETTRKAKEIFKTTIEGVRQAILDQKEALDKQEDSLRSEAERTRDAAKANLEHEISIRKATQALLEQAIAQENVDKIRSGAPGQRGELGTLALEQSTNRVSGLQAKLDEQAKLIQAAQQNLTNAQSFVDTEAGKNAADPSKVVEKRYDTLIEQARRRAVEEGKVGAALADQVKSLEAQKKAALNAIRASSSRSGMSGREINSDEAKSIAQRAGFQVNSADRTYAQQKALYDQWVAAGKPADNPVAKPGTSAHENGNALDIQFGQGVTPESIRKAFADEGVRLTKLFKERGHFHIEWSTSGADKVQREADQLAQFGQRAADSIARINDRFNEQPRLVDAAAAATRELDKTIAELAGRQPPGFEKMIADAQAAKGVIEDALMRPMQDITRETERRAEIDALLVSGKEAEARALQYIFQLENQLGTEEEIRKQIQNLILAGRMEEAAVLERLASHYPQMKADAVALAKTEQQRIEANQRILELQSAYLDATRSVRSEVEAILGGYGKLSNLRNIFQQLQGRVMAEKLFGNVFRDLDKWVKEKTGIGSSIDMMAKEVDRAGQAANTFADKLNEATAKLSTGGGISTFGVTSTGGGTTGSGTIGSPWALATFATPALLAAPSQKSPVAANDNKQIVVEAPKSTKATVNDLTPEQYFQQMSAKLTAPLIKELSQLVGPGLAKALGGPLTGALEGYLTTGTGFGAVLGGLKDLKGLPDGLSKGLGKAFGGAQTGAKIAGIGNALGLGLSNTGSQIGGAIGSFLPGGAIVGSLIGGLVGKLFGKRPRGGGAVTQDSLDVHANDAGITDALGSFGSSLQGAIKKIADALGGSVGSYNVGIGRYKDYYQVSGVGNDPRLGNSYFGRDSKNAVYDGKDAEAAMRAAILNALQDGAVTGIREGSKRLLAAGKDLDAQIQKAVDFENVFKDLKKIEDPVGAALDTLDAQFTKLKATFVEAGASAAEMASLEKLYGIRRAEAIKQANDQILGSLKDLNKSLTIDNPNRSLQEREALAQAAYKPLEDRVKAGDTTAFNDYAQASRDLLDIQRQLYGSQAQYFASEDNIKSVTQNAINKAQQVSDAAANRDSPFKSITGAANDNTKVTSAINDQTNQLAGLLGAANANLGQLIRQNRELAANLTKLYAGGGYVGGRGNF